MKGPERRIVGAEGLRACAALLVLAYHALSFAGATSAGPLALFAAELKGGVAVFFVLSGFLLYLPFARAIATAQTLPGWREYAARRAVRILPGYWAALVLLAVAGQANGVFSADGWRYVTLAQIYRPSTLELGLPVAWSLCVEVTFYVALPLLAGVAAWMAARSRRARLESQLGMLVALALGGAIFRLMLARSIIAPVGQREIVLATVLPGMIDWFALGMAVAVLRCALELGKRPPPPLRALATRPGLCWLIAAALYLVAVPAQQGELFLGSWGVAAHVLVGLAATFVILPVVSPLNAAARGGVMGFLASRPLVWLGVISYGIYLWHASLLKVIDAAAGRPRGLGASTWLFAVALIGAICLGAASWYLVERPAHRRYASSRGRVSSATPQAAAPPAAPAPAASAAQA